MPASTAKSRTLTLKPNSIVVYKRPKGMDDDEFEVFIHAAANDVLARFGISTIVVGVESWDEIMVCDEDTMEKYGWYKKDKIFLLRDQVDLTQYTADELEYIATMVTDNIEEYKRTSTAEEEE